MKTSKKRISPPGEEKLMSLPADSPASLSALPDSVKERQITVTSGRKCFGRYERHDPLGLLVKTLLESFQWYNPAVRLQWNIKPLYSKRLTKKRYSNKSMLSKPSAEILSKRDIPSSRLLFRLVPSARHIEGTGFGLLPTVQTQGLKVCSEKGKTEFINLKLLPTPTAMMPGDQDMKKLDARRQAVRRRKGNGNGFGVTLNEMAKKGLLPTPTNSMVTYQDFIQAGFHSSKRPEYRLIPTPVANDAKNIVPYPSQQNRDSVIGYLMRKGMAGETSQLNPLFVAEMMGFPSMWSALPFLSAGGAQDRSKDTETP